MQNNAYASVRHCERLTSEGDQSDIASSTPRPGVPVTVLIADDHPVVRDGITTILSSQPDIMVVADAADGEEAYWLCQLLLPDIVILDLRLPKKDGIQILRELMLWKTSKPKVLIVTSYDTQEDIRRAVHAGAKAFLTKVADRQEICEAVRRVAHGESYFPAEVLSKVVKSFSQAELSKREIEVLQRMARGKSNKEIGVALYISEGTVKYHVSSILRKLDAIGRVEAIAVAIRRGLVRVG